MIGLLGSGFGLYGYLPAIRLVGDYRVVLPSRYAETLRTRPDLRHHLAEPIEWVAHDVEVIAKANALIVSRRPVDQVAVVESILAAGNISRVLLEKPVAIQPEQARDVLAKLESKGKIVRIGYSFIDLPWADALRSWVKTELGAAAVSIEWQFKAHHHVHGLETWKRQTSGGGGALRFYGIQLIGLLAELGYNNCSQSYTEGPTTDEAEIWSADLVGPALPPCRIVVGTKAATKFFALCGSAPAPSQPLKMVLNDPFEGTPATAGQDRRVLVLAELVRSLLGSGAAQLPWHKASINLWDAVERRTEHCVRPC